MSPLVNPGPGEQLQHIDNPSSLDKEVSAPRNGTSDRPSTFGKSHHTYPDMMKKRHPSRRAMLVEDISKANKKRPFGFRDHRGSLPQSAMNYIVLHMKKLRAANQEKGSNLHATVSDVQLTDNLEKGKAKYSSNDNIMHKEENFKRSAHTLQMFAGHQDSEILGNNERIGYDKHDVEEVHVGKSHDLAKHKINQGHKHVAEMKGKHHGHVNDAGNHKRSTFNFHRYRDVLTETALKYIELADRMLHDIDSLSVHHMRSTDNHAVKSHKHISSPLRVDDVYEDDILQKGGLDDTKMFDFLEGKKSKIDTVNTEAGETDNSHDNSFNRVSYQGSKDVPKPFLSGKEVHFGKGTEDPNKLYYTTSIRHVKHIPKNIIHLGEVDNFPEHEFKNIEDIKSNSHDYRPKYHIMVEGHTNTENIKGNNRYVSLKVAGDHHKKSAFNVKHYHDITHSAMKNIKFADQMIQSKKTIAHQRKSTNLLTGVVATDLAISVGHDHVGICLPSERDVQKHSGSQQTALAVKTYDFPIDESLTMHGNGQQKKYDKYNLKEVSDGELNNGLDITAFYKTSTQGRKHFSGGFLNEKKGNQLPKRDFENVKEFNGYENFQMKASGNPNNAISMVHRHKDSAKDKRYEILGNAVQHSEKHSFNSKRYSHILTPSAMKYIDLAKEVLKTKEHRHTKRNICTQVKSYKDNNDDGNDAPEDTLSDTLLRVLAKDNNLLKILNGTTPQHYTKVRAKYYNDSKIVGDGTRIVKDRASVPYSKVTNSADFLDESIANNFLDEESKTKNVMDGSRFHRALKRVHHHRHSRFWSPWSKWTECSVTCGVGRSLRHRKCKVKHCKDNVVLEIHEKSCIFPGCKR